MRLSKTAFFTLASLAAMRCASPLPASILLVANKTDNTVDLIDLHRQESVATLPTGHAPHEIAVSPDGKVAVVANYGDREKPGATLTVVDIGRAEVDGEIDLGDHTRPHGLVFVGQERVAVTAEGSRHLLVVDLRDRQVASAIDTGQEISHMVTATADGRRAFVANIGSGSVTAIDLRTGRKLADIPTGEGAEGIAVTPDGREVWVTNRGADTLSVIDPETLEVVATVDCPGFPIRIAVTPDGQHALVSAASTGEVVVIDIQRRREVRRTQLDLSTAPDAGSRLFGDRFGESPVPVGLVVHPLGSLAWVAATQADVVVAVDPADLTVRGLLTAGREPDGMAFSSAEPPSGD